MTSKKQDRVLKELDMGIIPYEMSYGLEKECFIDWTAMIYNDWDDFDYWIDKRDLRDLIEQWPCLLEVFKAEFDNREKLTPLEEMELRKLESLKIE